jgi:predicted metal-dependent phosphoesterase TrpH
MSPRDLVGAARARGLDIIAITDHNSCENVEASKRAAYGTGMTILGGMEVSSSEEVHILGLFNETGQMLRMQDIIYENLPEQENDERLYGHQVIANEFNEVLAFNRRLLIAATKLNLRELVETIHSLGGLAIASHIDRESFSVLSQLGFIPADVRFDALELSPKMTRGLAEAQFKGLRNLPWVSFSDAHHVADIGRRVTTFRLKEPTLEEIRLALVKRDGRDTCWETE